MRKSIAIAAVERCSLTYQAEDSAWGISQFISYAQASGSSISL